MKCTTVIDKAREEEVLIYAHEKSDLTEAIEALVRGNSTELLGFGDGTVVKLQATDIFCFTVEDGKIFATTEREKWQIKQRLYVLEESLGGNFVKINQSCLVNVRQIARFEASIGGALLLILKNGYKDYVSRRQMKNVKERIGL